MRRKIRKEEEGEDELENDNDAEPLRMMTSEGEEGEDKATATLRRATDSGGRGRGGESLASTLKGGEEKEKLWKGMEAEIFGRRSGKPQQRKGHFIFTY
ncbi:hypothetical protein ACLOJK_037156 [Asimina triloba]